MSDIIIGYNKGRDEKTESVALHKEDRRRHLYVVGKTGTGKTTLIENAIIQDIRNGNGLCFIDPHGEAAERLLSFIPYSRLNHVVYINPADPDYAVGINALETKNNAEKDCVASSVVSVFKHLYDKSWGARLEWLLYNSVRAAMDTPRTTLVDVYRMMINEEHRDNIVRNIKNPVVRSYWKEEFARYTRSFETEAFASVLNKVGQMITSSTLINIVGQPKSTVDFRHLMDTKHIVIVNLAKGKIGESRASLLGSLIITKCYLAALERIVIPEEKRQDFHLYVDEFQSFSTDTFKEILSEARKYRLNLTLAHQYLDQVSEDILPAIFGNVGAIIAFRVGSKDAFVLQREFEPYFDCEDLRSQTNHHIYYKRMVDGEETPPSFAKTYPPIGRVGDEVSREEVIAMSRKWFARRTEDVKKQILQRFFNE